MSLAEIDTDKNRDTLSIATFNLLNYLEPPFACYEFERIYSSEQWQKKQSWISDYLDEFQPDVVGFQEVFSPESLQALVKKSGYEYFAVIDEATIVDDFICFDPVVAIASRYPIIAVNEVTVDSCLAIKMGLAADFSFSRKVLRATIKLPHLEQCDCYVVHFKSKRARFEHTESQLLSGQKNIIESFKASVAGRWASSLQRGSEAALLQVEIIKRREESGNPMMLMGDFNNQLDDGILSHLITNELRFVSIIDKNKYLHQYCLQDAWDLYRRGDFYQGDERQATHYYGQTSSVLDYLLFSCEFDAQYDKNVFELCAYHTYDRHLINPIFERDGESTDHGIVLIDFRLRT